MSKNTTHKSFPEMALVFEKYADKFEKLNVMIDFESNFIPTVENPGGVANHIANFNTTTRKPSNLNYYSRGKRIFSEELGFRDFGQLETFLIDNPTIWGNPNGADLFDEDSAYSEGESEYGRLPCHINRGTLMVVAFDTYRITPLSVAIKFSAVSKRLKKILEDNK